ncbi:UvrD-helicase domain-containing protein [Salmonella enterica subsp. enterica]|nr:UvrD-helicase domain-containing protein [Salmonella enterica subsp. enterica]
MKSGEALAAAIRIRFPVAMIDEQSQDTDPQQCHFSPYLATSTRYGAIADYDPKQAIYAFRGADILPT